MTNPDGPKPSILSANGADIAYHHTPATAQSAAPGVIFCGGFMSDMTGTKAVALEGHCRAHGPGFTRFDYRGHGQSSGAFADHVVSDWVADALAVIDNLTEGPLVLVGSSMGGWIALHAALAQPDRVKALILIAPAPDFTSRLMAPGFTAQERQALARDGLIKQPSDYGDDYTITKALIDDGEKLGLLHAPIAFAGPVRILHGQQDTAVPWDLSLELMDKLDSPDVVASFIKSGDHRLSEPEDIKRLTATLDEVRSAINA